MTTGIAPTTTNTNSSTQSASAAAKNTLAQNYDSFLKLLTTQLQHQDPLSPMDSSQFVSQLVQFSEVEQAIATNSNLENLIKIENSNQTTAALGYIGNTVEASGSSAPLQNGQAQFSYNLTSAGNTEIVITDQNGSAVAVANGESTAGKHTFTWDGKTLDGSTAPDGIYNIQLLGADGKPLTVDTTGFGKVTGVESGTNGLTLDLGGLQVPVANILSVQAAAASQSQTAAN
jgi:flagellar basal-body rod modification protein FlgD